MWGFPRRATSKPDNSLQSRLKSVLQEASLSPDSLTEARSVLSDWNKWFDQAFTLNSGTATGKNVTVDTSLKVATVYACIKVLSETIASLPLHVYRRLGDGGKEIATDHPLYSILHIKPNSMQTSFEWREFLIAQTAARGNHVSFIKKSQNKILELQPLDITAIKKVEKDVRGRVVYTYQASAQPEETFDRDELAHIKLFSENGLWGLSPITECRESIGLALATQEHAAKFFANDATPGVMLVHPGKLKEDVAKRLITSWDEAHAGSGNARKTVVLEEGIKPEKMTLSMVDAQFVETSNLQIEDIARIFRVPGILIGHPDKTSTYASAEQFMLSFVVHTILPWTVRIEQVFNWYLFNESERGTYFCEHSIDGLLRGDIKSRFEAYQLAIQNRILNPNECRALENRNPYPGGEKFENPNITPGEPNKDKSDEQKG